MSRPESLAARRRMFDIRRSAFDADGNRVIRVRVPALTTHPDELRRVLGSSGPLALEWVARLGEHELRGAVDPERARFTMRFRRGVHPDGAWRVTLRAGERELWRQSVFVQGKLARSPERIRALALRYAPVFVFSAKERYFPVSLRTLLRSPLVKASEETLTLKTIFGKETIPLRELGDFMRYNGHADYLLDFNLFSMKRTVFAKLGGSPAGSTIYYSYLEEPGTGRFFISYHLLYAFDTKTGLSRLTGIGPHVFDRESMLFVFDEREAPSSLIVSGHLEHQTIAFLHKLKRWSQGRLRVPYDDPRTLKLGTHPVIAVGEGSHALYPTSGEYQLSLLREIAGYVDPGLFGGRAAETGAAISPAQILIPPSLASTQVPGYRLASFGLDRLVSRIERDDSGHDPYRAFLVFSGYWVDVPGSRNARFPPFTRNVTEVSDWVDGAYQWEWDDVPESYLDNNQLILRFLQENTEDF